MDFSLMRFNSLTRWKEQGALMGTFHIWIRDALRNKPTKREGQENEEEQGALMGLFTWIEPWPKYSIFEMSDLPIIDYWFQIDVDSPRRTRELRR